MTALSTHDTKRSEDVRARIAVLAEIAGASGRATLDELLRLGAAAGPRLRSPAVAGGARRLARPRPRERLHAYAEKAMREAGDRTDVGRPRRGATRRRCTRRSTRRSTTSGCARSSTALDATWSTPAACSNALAAKLVR